MNEQHLPQELIQHLCSSSVLTPEQAQRLVLEVLDYYKSSPEQFVVERHRELQKAGVANTTIYQLIERELTTRLFSGPKMSTRQIRRLIYG